MPQNQLDFSKTNYFLYEYGGKVYKFRVQFSTCDAQQQSPHIALTETTSVLAALMEAINTGSSLSLAVQTKSFLFDCTLKPWNAAHKLDFKRNNTSLAAYENMFIIIARPKSDNQTSSDVLPGFLHATSPVVDVAARSQHLVAGSSLIRTSVGLSMPAPITVPHIPIQSDPVETRSVRSLRSGDKQQSHIPIQSDPVETHSVRSLRSRDKQRPKTLSAEPRNCPPNGKCTPPATGRGRVQSATRYRNADRFSEQCLHDVDVRSAVSNPSRRLRKIGCKAVNEGDNSTSTKMKLRRLNYQLIRQDYEMEVSRMVNYNQPLLRTSARKSLVSLAEKC